MASLQFHPISIPHQLLTNALALRPILGFNRRYGIWSGKNNYRGFLLGVSSNSSISGDDNSLKDEVTFSKSVSNGMVVLQHQVSRLQETVVSLPPVVFVVKSSPRAKFALGFCIATSILIVALRVYVARKFRQKRPGSVADLVRRGQLNSDRRGISNAVMYDDPFDNPQVKISKNNSSVEMCGKVYKLAPVTLTREEQNIHQKRRSRAYQWKRPTIFLKEGDPIPSDVDPDTVRWIPANHPFATTISDITEDLAQNNVFQKHGVPFRIQAEHEALQKKLEALQIDQKLNNMVIDPGTARNFERPFKSTLKSDDQQGEPNTKNGQSGPRPDSQQTSIDSNNNSTSEEKQNL
ncbi:protein MULTIPLE CHLOROPLAST DIVISION SITE 1 [Rutidosis leptorrhynchoides]|uniref:protein MULTIPLE CHLOROPLAST DIVISION SITE 1 n=1 Tax=Rutidosis leptorrhynchoides TaxID=125765 RepID=UPI003A99F2E9